MDHFREAERLIKQAENYTHPGLRRADFLGAIAHGIAGVLEAMQHTPINLGEPTDGVRVPVWAPPMRDDRQDRTEATS